MTYTLWALQGGPSKTRPTLQRHNFMPETWTFHSAGQIILGRNAVLRLGEVAEQLSIKRAFIVTDAILVQAGLVDRVRTPFKPGWSTGFGRR